MLYVECFLGAYDLVGAEGQWACLAALVGAGFGADPFWWLEGWEGGVDEGVTDALVSSVADQGEMCWNMSPFSSEFLRRWKLERSILRMGWLCGW